MKPLCLPDMNITLAPPASMPDGTVCDPVRAYHMPDGFVTVWELDDEDLLNILANGRIILRIIGYRHPPVVLGTQDRNQ